MKRILVIYSSAFGQTQAVATRIADCLRADGHTVVLSNIEDPPATPYGFDAIVIGARVQFGKHGPEVARYIEKFREPLSRRQTAFFSVSMSAATAGAGPDPHGYIATFLQTAKWQPGRWIAIGGGLPFRKYNPLLRLVMKYLAKRGGHSTDTSKNHEYTNWSQVDQFAHDLAASLNEHDTSPTAPPAPSTSPPTAAGTSRVG